MEEKIKEIISPNVNEINSYLKELLKDNSYVVFREFNVSGKKCLLVCIDGISDKNLTNNFVMETLLDNNSLVNLSEKQLFDILTTSDMKKSSNLRDSNDINIVLQKYEDDLREHSNEVRNLKKKIKMLAR